MQDFQDGQSQTINGTTYVRQGGVWHAQGNTGPVYGLGLHPTPQTPEQAQGQTLQNVHTQQEIASQPLQNDNTRVNIQQGQASIQNQKFNQNQGLRQEFNNLPEVKNYSVALQSLGTALNAPDTPQGDLGVIYAYAKAADPGSVVREGEMDMATATASIPEQYRAAAQRLTQGQRLPPEVRVGLIEAMRHSVAGLRQVYDQQYGRYSQLAKQNGFDPTQIVGHPLYEAYRPLEEKYIQAHGETPVDPAHPNDQSYALQGDIGLKGPKSAMNPQQQTAYDVWLQANPNATADQLVSFAHSIGLPGIANADRIIADRQKGIGVAPASTAIQQEDPRAKALADQYMQQGGSQGAAGIAGAADAASLGTSDEVGAGINALGQSLSGNGSFADNFAVNEAANRDYQQRLQDAHGPTYLAGQVGGSLLLPTFGATDAAGLAKVGAGYGAAYGAGSGEGLQGRLAGAVEGGAAGGALGYVAPKAVELLKSKPTEVPPLVDPQTGQLNQPLEAMTPGQRVVKAEEYGVNLPADAAGGRTAAVIGKGLDIMPGSAGVMEDARRATESQIAGASDVVASNFGKSRTMNEAGAELQRGANEYMDRAQATAGKLYDRIPISDQAQTSLANTKGTLQELQGQFSSNPELQQSLKSAKIDQYATALEKGGLSWADLKAFRSRIGYEIGEQRLSGDSPTKDQLRALYGALSDDMRDTAAAQGPGALKAFERANSFYNQKETLIDNAISKIVGKDLNQRPELAAANVRAMTMGGKTTGDLKTLAQIKSATVKSGAWNEIASTLIRLGGQPANSAGRDFSPTTFVNWYADMAEPARQMLFGGTNSDLRKALDGFVSVSQRLQKVNALRNTSNTAGNMTAAGTVGAMAASATNPMIGVKLLGVMAGNFGMAKLWTNPGFVRLMTGYSKAVASGSQSAVKSQIGRISALAATNPDLREPLIALQQRLLKGANDNAMRGAAASQSNTQESK